LRDCDCRTAPCVWLLRRQGFTISLSITPIGRLLRRFQRSIPTRHHTRPLLPSRFQAAAMASSSSAASGSAAHKSAAGSGYNHGKYEFWVDRGGTFTDIVCLAPGVPCDMRPINFMQCNGNATCLNLDSPSTTAKDQTDVDLSPECVPMASCHLLAWPRADAEPCLHVCRMTRTYSLPFGSVSPRLTISKCSALFYHATDWTAVPLLLAAACDVVAAAESATILCPT
jgi:hypothetical protein